MKTAELRQKSLLELQKILKELREKLFEYRISKVQNRLKKPNLPRGVKNDIARVLTIIKQKTDISVDKYK